MTAAPYPPAYPPAIYVRALFDYDPDTGALTWRERPRAHFRSDRDHRTWNRMHAGTRAETQPGTEYLTVVVHSLGRRPVRIQAHRVCWLILTGRWCHVSQLNGDQSDNRAENLTDEPAPSVAG